jgi:cell division protease FtsH
MTYSPTEESAGKGSVPVALKTLARKAQGLTGADIERWVREARQKARREGRQLAYGDLESLLSGAKPTRSTALRMRIAVHEAGHAVARMLVSFDRISEITIDGSRGGFVDGELGLDDEMTETRLTALLIATLAGRAAEEVMLDAVSINSGGPDHSDLALVTRLAFDMETVLGLGGRWPLVHRTSADFAKASAVDPELVARVNERLERAYAAALTVVRDQEEAIDFLADRLFEAGTLDGPDLDNVLDEVGKRFRERPM